MSRYELLQEIAIAWATHSGDRIRVFANVPAMRKYLQAELGFPLPNFSDHTGSSLRSLELMLDWVQRGCKKPVPTKDKRSAKAKFSKQDLEKAIADDEEACLEGSGLRVYGRQSRIARKFGVSSQAVSAAAKKWKVDLWG